MIKQTISERSQYVLQPESTATQIYQAPESMNDTLGPYIGISGVASQAQQETIDAIASEYNVQNIDRYIALGIQASTKTQLHDIENSYGSHYFPVGEHIKHASAIGRHTRNFVHIALDDQRSPNFITNRLLVDRVLERTDSWRQGVQINMAAVKDTRDYEGLRELLGRINRLSPSDRIVLQLHPQLLNNRELMLDLAWDYSGLVDYVLIDQSLGRGEKYDIEQTRDLIGKIAVEQPAFGLGIAGGLSGHNVQELFGPLLDDFPDLSCDAQGQLRKLENGISVLDMSAVRDYIAMTAWAIRSRRPNPFVDHFTRDR